MAQQVRNSVLVMVFLGVALACPAAFGTPTSLNDIPIAEVLPWRTAEIEVSATTGERESPDWFAGLNVGILDYAEIGVDGQIGPTDTEQGDVRFQGKFVYPFGEGLPSVGAGVQNVTDDEDENGSIDPYLVVTHDFGPVRGHLGYSFQDDDEALFAGIDTSFYFLELPATVGFDATQTDDGDEWLVSAGFEYALPLSFVIESWYTWTTVDGAEDAITFRLNWVINF